MKPQNNSIMTTEFSFPRIGLLLKSEIARNYKIYLTL